MSNMLKMLYRTVLPALLVMTVIAGCAGKKAQPVSTQAVIGDVITIQAGSRSFTPSLVKIEKPGTFTLQIINTTGSETNFTLKNPLGKIIKAVNITSKGTSISIIDLPDIGSYDFYSDKKFRASMGMKGRIVVGNIATK